MVVRANIQTNLTTDRHQSHCNDQSTTSVNHTNQLSQKSNAKSLMQLATQPSLRGDGS